MLDALPKVEFPLNISSSKQLEKLLNVNIWNKFRYPLKYKIRYAIHLHFNRFIYFNEKFLSNNAKMLDVCLGAACYTANLEIIDYIIKLGASDFRLGLQKACKGGHMEIVKKMRKLGACNYNKGLVMSCIGDHIEIAELMIECGAKNLDYALEYACEYNRIELVKFLFQKGAKFTSHTLNKACMGNNINIVKIVINNKSRNMNKGRNISASLYYACNNNNLEIVQLLIENKINNWNKGLEGACSGGHMSMAELMIKYGANNWDSGLQIACREEHLDLVKLMIQKGATDYNSGLDSAKGLPIVKLMIEKGATKYIDAFRNACFRGHIETIKFMIEKMDNLYPPLHIAMHDEELIYKAGLINVCYSQDLSVLQFMLETIKNKNFKMDKYDIQGIFNNACSGGNLEIVVFIENMYKPSSLSYGLENAIDKNNLEVIEYLQKKIADQISACVKN